MRIIAFFAMAILLVACKEKVEKKETIRPVFYQKLSEGNISGKRSFAGMSQAENEAKLSFKVGGTLEKINFKMGQTVKKGEVIAVLNSDDYKINYQKALASKKNAQIQVSSAKSSFERIEKLYASNNASLSDFEKVKTQYESAKAMLRTVLSQLKAAKNQLDYTQLKAPFDGSISRVLVEESEMIGPGRPVVMFLSNGNVEVKTQVPENIIQQIEIGQVAKIKFTAVPNKEYDGVISEIGRSTGGASTYPLILDLSDIYNEVLPGMACTIEMNFEKKDSSNNTILVPFDAVAHDEGGDFVYVVENTDTEGIYKATRKTVKLGELTSEAYEIKEGLSPDDIIITAGLSFMYDGRKVRLLEK